MKENTENKPRYNYEPVTLHVQLADGNLPKEGKTTIVQFPEVGKVYMPDHCTTIDRTEHRLGHVLITCPHFFAEANNLLQFAAN